MIKKKKDGFQSKFNEMKKIAVITVVYKFPQARLNKFLKNIEDQGIPKRVIFVKDNTNDNIGYGAAINAVLKRQLKNFDYFLILNPDTILGKNCIKSLREMVDNHPKIDILGPRIITHTGKSIFGGNIDPLRYSSILKEVSLGTNINTQDVQTVEYVSGSAMLIRREVFETIGLFSEDYFIYYEEVDFCFRARKAGFGIAIAPKATIYHSGSATVGKASPAMDYYMARNHLLFLQRFAPLFIQVREFIRLPRTIWQARRRPYELMGIKDFFLRKFGRNNQIKNQVDL